MYTVKFRSVGNPDFGQYAPVSNRESHACDSLQEAAALARRYIEFWNLGGGNWPKTVVKQGKRTVATISYNGRLWDMSGKPL